MSGWCVTCQDLTYTECSRADQDDVGWCAVEGECGIASTDVKALASEAEGGYGWTHWDSCIGEPAGFLPAKDAELKASKRAKLSQKHGVSVESVVMKHDHKEVVGRAKGHVDVSEAKAKAVQKAIARAIHQKGAATVKAADALQGKRGRGGDQKTDAEIKALAKQMRQSIKALDGKIQKLDESSASGLRSAHMVGLLSVLVALLAAQAH